MYSKKCFFYLYTKFDMPVFIASLVTSKTKNVKHSKPVNLHYIKFTLIGYTFSRALNYVALVSLA